MTALTRLGGMLAALAAFSAHAQSPESLDLAGRLFERSGLAVQLQSFPEQFEQGALQNRGKIPDEVIEALVDAGKLGYALPALRAEIVPLFAHKLSAADMKQVLEWLDGPAGRRVTLAEESASGRMTPEVLQAYIESEKAKPSSPERARLLADISTATNAAEIGASFIEGMLLGIAVGMDAAQPVEKRIGMAGLRARLRAAIPPEKLRADMSASLPVMNGYTYREIGERDLAAYLKFNQSAVGKRYNEAVTEALAEALVGASVRVGQLVQTAPQKKQI